MTYRLAGVLTHTGLHIFQLAVHGVQDALKIQRTQCRGSGSGWTGIILADPDRHLEPAHPDPFPFQPVLRMRDVYPGSRILIFTHPGSRIQKKATTERGEKNWLSYIYL